jgi:hypothetical protein
MRVTQNAWRWGAVPCAVAAAAVSVAALLVFLVPMRECNEAWYFNAFGLVPPLVLPVVVFASAWSGRLTLARFAAMCAVAVACQALMPLLACGSALIGGP